MTPADELRQAAERIREVADAATPGPWGVGNGTNICRNVEQLSVGSYTCTQAVADTDLFDGREEWTEDDPEYVETDPEDDAEHIALWHPGVALLVAALLERWAWMGRLDPDLMRRIGGDEIFAIARAINGGVS